MSLTRVNNGSWTSRFPKTLALVLLLAMGYAYSRSNAGSTVTSESQPAIDLAGSNSESQSGTAPAAAGSGSTVPIIEPKVRQVLDRACGELASARTVIYHAEINFDSVLPSGVKLQYAAAMDTAIKRPDHLAISYKSDLGAKEIWYDGKTLTIYDPAHRAYASTKAPDSIDAMFRQVAEEKHLSIPLENLNLNHPCERAYRDVQRSKYVGVNDVGGVECDHFAFSQRQADWQLWVDHSGKPVPHKIVITYKHLPAQPQWAAVFSQWRFNQNLPASLFSPKIPKGAIKTSFIGKQEKQQ